MLSVVSNASSISTGDPEFAARDGADPTPSAAASNVNANRQPPAQTFPIAVPPPEDDS
jgi:hypothetical protein